MNNMNQDKWNEIKNKPLFTGSGTDIDHACVMQMVSYVAGEKWTDHPTCACPVLTQYAIRMNDRFKDEHRQLLKPFIPELVGTRANDEVEIARIRLMRWRNVTVTYPLILDFLKIPKFAEKLRMFENNLESMALATKFLKENKEEIHKRASAYVNAYAYSSASASAYADADDYADDYANDYADADDNAYAYADAYVNASAYASASASAYAYALRENIVAVAIETLRLAIEVGKP